MNSNMLNENKNNFFLAIDGGGTKTTVWIADESGNVLGRATTGPMSLAATTEALAMEHFMTAISEAVEHLDVAGFSQVVVGLAGVDTDEEIADAYRIFSTALHERFSFLNFKVVNDIVIALASGSTSPNTICLISGTGSNCYGRNEQGETAKTGGMDYLLSDQGSGFEIGQQVLRAAVKSFDGRSKKTMIEELVCQHFFIESISQLKDKVYHPLLNKTQIGQLSQICFAAKEQHDAIANEIIAASIEELVEMVVTVMKRLHLTKKLTDVVLIGGIATDPVVHIQLEARLLTHFSQIKLIVPAHPPVYGALQLALQK
ncbi:MAG: BadF/BadG/BcrA/BcrD ATPase family protein [Patescibacteria group bacterium]